MSSWHPLYAQKSSTYPQKSPTYPQKSCIYLRTSPTYVSRHALSCCLSDIFHLDIHYTRKRALHLRKRALHICKRAVYIRESAPHLCLDTLDIDIYDTIKRALHIRKRALHIRKRAVYIRESAPHLCLDTLDIDICDIFHSRLHNCGIWIWKDLKNFRFEWIVAKTLDKFDLLHTCILTSVQIRIWINEFEYTNLSTRICMDLSRSRDESMQLIKCV